MAKKKSILDLYQMKEAGEQAVWMTAYDYPFASYAEKAGIDMILVGDSMGMIVHGFSGTVPVTMDMCILQTQAVRRGAPNTYLIGDMPYGSYHISAEQAVENAVRFMKEADVDAIKLEGGVAVADKIHAISQAGVVVFGHVGLTPQSSAVMGGFRAQGRTTDSARAVIEDAVAAYKAGAKVVLIEGVPEEVSQFIHKLLPCPVYGIGAGAGLDGQVLVNGDMLGMFDGFCPKFAKRYADVAGVVTEACAQFVRECKEGVFPAPEHKYRISGELAPFRELFAELENSIEL